MVGGVGRLAELVWARRTTGHSHNKVAASPQPDHPPDFRMT